MSSKLSEREKEIIACTFFRSDLSARQTAKETGYREHTVRATLKSLRERAIISDRVYINPFALGLLEYQVFFKILTPGEAARQALAALLRESPHTSWVSAIGGPHQLCCMLLVRATQDLDVFFEDISSKIRSVIFERSVVPCVRVTLFPPKYFSKNRYSPASISYSDVTTVERLDPQDYSIVSTLVKSKPFSFSNAARMLGMPITTLDYRVKALKASGVILGFGYYISDFYKDGMSPSFMKIRCKSLTSSTKSQLLNYCQTHPNVTYMIRCLGQWDYEIGLKVATPADLSRVVEEFQLHFQNEISHVEIFPVFSLIKLAVDPSAVLDASVSTGKVLGF